MDPDALPAPRRDIRALTGIRFLAAAWVVLFHFQDGWGLLVPQLLILRPVGSVGYLGVDLFFILSGFILTYTHLGDFESLHRRNYLRFLGLRLARIYPVHLATLVFLLILLAATSLIGTHPHRPDGFTLPSFLANVLLVQGWHPADTLGSWNYASWSISAEWFAYLLFPILALLLLKVSARKSMIWLLTSAVAVQFVIHVWLLPTAGPLVRILPEFVVGGLLCRLFTQARRDPAWSAPTSLFALLSAPLLASIALSRGINPAVAVPLFALLIFTLAFSQGWTARVLGSASLVFLGEASYSIYMTHGLVGMIGDRVLPFTHFAHSSVAVRGAVFAIYVVTILALGILTLIVVERPSRRRLKRSIDRRFGATSVSPHLLRSGAASA